jgi:hypothetical protein
MIPLVLPNQRYVFDPYYQNVSLLIHCDGSNGSTTITDSGPKGKSPSSVNGDAKISTAQSKFGGASLLLDGSGDYINYGDDADFEFGSSDFTVERSFAGTLHPAEPITQPSWENGA